MRDDSADGRIPQAPDFTDDDFRDYDETPQTISLEQIIRDCYTDGIPKKRFWVQVPHWWPCFACGEPIADVVVTLDSFTADVSFHPNEIGLIRPFADLLRHHKCKVGGR